MNSGEQNTRIKIEKRSEEIVGGRKKEAWNDYYSCWCKVLDLIGKEKYEAYNTKLENSFKFKCRKCMKIKNIIFETKEYRIIWEGRVFDILFIDTMGNSKTDIILQVVAVS